MPVCPKTRIAIHSAPRSGSSWLGQIVNSSPAVNYSYQPLFSYAFKGLLTPNSTKSEIRRFFDRIAESDDDFLKQEERILNGTYPSFRKQPEASFLVYKEVRYHHILENLLDADDELLLVGLIRNPLSVLSSWFRAPREFRKDQGWEELEEWRHAPRKNRMKEEEFYGYEKWKEVALLLLRLRKRQSERVYIVKFQELLKDPLLETKKLFEFCRIPLEQQTVDFLERSCHTHSCDPYSVFRNNHTDDSWKRDLHPLIVDQIVDDLKGSELEEYLRN